MWTRPLSRQDRRRVPIGHITNGVHVPSWLAPQMFRLYDRHLGTGWHEHSSEAQNLGRHRKRRRRRALGNAPQPEIAAARFRARAAPMEQAERRGESPRNAAAARQRAESRCADHRICAALRHLQARQSDSGRHRTARARWSTIPSARCSSFSPAKRIRATSRASACCSRSRELMRDPQFADKFVFVEDYDINVGRHFVQGVDVWLNNPRRPLEASRHQRPESGAERRPESFGARRLVGRSLRRPERLRHRHRQNAFQHERPRHARRRRPVPRRCAKK